MKPRTQAAAHSRVHPWSEAIAIIVLCSLSIVLYRRIALTNRILSGTDAMTYFFPYRAYAAQAIRSGQFPLWNPYLFLGVPFFANPQAAVLYPPNLVLGGLTAPKQVAWSLVIHSALASVLAYAYARRSLALSPLAAFLGAAAFGQGGYLVAQAEHVNQVNVLAWFPLLLLLWDVRNRVPWLAISGLAVTIGLGLLAGHTQATYISLAGLSVYALVTGFWLRVVESSPGLSVSFKLWSWSKSVLAVLWPLVLVVVVAFGLAAVQVLPTLELSQLSVRGRGLGYRQAVAFSLAPIPRLLRYTFLPVLGQERGLGVLFGGDFYTEYLAPIGCVPFLLALVACGCWVWQVWRFVKSRDRKVVLCACWLHEVRGPVSLSVLAGTGLFLALGLYNPFYWLLYKLVPGFGLFRVPARWLFLYAFSAAMLAGIGLQVVRDWLASHAFSRLSVKSRRLRRAQVLPALLAAVGLAELLLAAQHLPINHPTAPESFSSLRTAPAHILAAQTGQTAPGRFLSMSDIVFDPGDLGEIEQIYRGQLTSQPLYNHIVNVKRQEILAPNLPLAWGIYAVDGYDGGVLPLARYISLQRLLLDESDILTDGRLREGLSGIPSSRILAIFGAEYIITDKVHDVWIDGVFYDLAFETALATDQAQGVTSAVCSLTPPYPVATSVGIVSHLQSASTVDQGARVASINLTTRSREGAITHRSFDLRAGQDTAQGLYEQAAHEQPQIGRRWQTQPGPLGTTGYDYVAKLSWDTPQEVMQVELKALPFEGSICIRGLALIDQRDGSSKPLLLTSHGHFEAMHSGDVKIYRALDALPRAYAVHQTVQVEDDEQAIVAMADPAFDPSQTVVLNSPERSNSSSPAAEMPDITSVPSRVDILSYKPQEIILHAELSQPGYIVLSDTWYPGWHATLDGRPAAIERANLAFRAIHVPQGAHNLRLSYQPASFAWGLRISLGSLLAVAVFLGLGIRQKARLLARQIHETQLDDQPTLGYNASVTKDREVET